MTRPLVSIIIPTIGRPSLGALLDSIPTDAHDPDLEVVVVGDTHAGDFKKDLADAHHQFDRPHVRWYTHDGGKHAWGHPQRNYAMLKAEGEWLVFSQDDNVFAPDAFEQIAYAISVQPYPRPLLFRVMTWQAGAVWRNPRLAEGDIDADCIVVPNLATKLGQWGERYQGDFDFILQTYNLWWGDVAWRTELIATALADIERHPG